jgi:hypothetical protein
MDKVQKVLLQTVVHHHQNPLDFTLNLCFSLNAEHTKKQQTYNLPCARHVR